MLILLSLNSEIVGLVSNHYRKSFHSIEAGTCLDCGAIKDDTEHIFFTCPSFAVLRMEMPQEMYREMSEINSNCNTN